MHNSALSILLRKVPKVTTLVTFGFSTLPLSLLSEARYFWGVVTFGRLKRVLNMGTFKKMWKKAMYRNVKQIIINKPRISVEINLFRVNLSYIRYFWQKGKLVLPRDIQHSLFWRYANFSKLMRTIQISTTSTFQCEYCQCFTFKRCDKFKLKCTSHGGMYSAHYFGKISITSKQWMLQRRFLTGK